jgi:hypothetical protein
MALCERASSDRLSTRSNPSVSAGAASARPDTVAQRRADSVKATELAARVSTLTLAESLALDDLSQRFSTGSEALHRRVVSVRLDSAAQMLRVANSEPEILAGRAMLSAVIDPHTSVQKKRSADLWALSNRKLERLRNEEQETARRVYARQFEIRMLDQGMDATVTVRGEHGTTLHMKWILVGRVLAHQMSQEPELFEKMREMGFKRFIITDGYDETWSWEL